jgi:hypothetical protein
MKEVPMDASAATASLDDIKSSWRAIEEKLDRQYALDLDRYARSGTWRARLWLAPYALGQFLSLGFAILLIAVAAPFWFEHLATAHLAASGIVVHAYGILLAAAAGRGIALALSMRAGAPVLENQRRLASLLRWRRLAGRVFGYLGCIVWVPMLLVGLGTWPGVDLVAVAPRLVAWMVASAGVALVAAAAIDAWYRRRARREAGGDDDGYALGRARAELDAIERFMKE